MSRTVQGTTLGGDFVIQEVRVGDGVVRAVLANGTDDDFERARLEVLAVTRRFARKPVVGDRHRVVIGMEPLEDQDAYAEQRETNVGVPISLLARIHQVMSVDALAGGGVSDADIDELGKILEAVSDYVADATEVDDREFLPPDHDNEDDYGYMGPGSDRLPAPREK